jgi:hypothetical protein
VLRITRYRDRCLPRQALGDNRPTRRPLVEPSHTERASGCSEHPLALDPITVHQPGRRTMTHFTTIPDTSSRNNVDLHQAPSSDGALPQEPAAPCSRPSRTAARHRAGTTRPTASATPRALDAAPAVAPVLGTAEGGVTSVVWPPVPRGGGFAARWRSWREGRFAAPAGAVWRRRSAALGFLPQQGSPLATESEAARPAPGPRRSFLPSWIFRRVLRGGSLVSRPSPCCAAGGSQARQPGHQPPHSGGAAKEGRKAKNCRGPVAHATEQPRRATFNSP